MIAVPYIFTHERIADAVKQESSLYAERKVTAEGENLFEHFVFDKEYNRKFRELFFDAQAEVMDRYSPYMEYELNDACVFEEADYETDKDFAFTLRMPTDYNKIYNKQVGIKTREFIVAYIMYRWLETKSAEEAAVYKNRADMTLIDARAYLEKRIAVRRKSGGNMF